MADEKVTVVDAGGGGGGGANMVLLIVGVIAILAVLYVLFGTNLLNNAPQKVDADIKIETPK